MYPPPTSKRIKEESEFQETQVLDSLKTDFTLDFVFLFNQ